MSEDLTVGTEAKSLRFIKDAPADQDEFGTHDRIAKAVASVIRSHDDLKVIGLIGPWGSGKSTVISLVEKDLLSDAKITTKFFIYDAWLHQSDPPRRSFLEQMVRFFNLLENEGWQTRLDKLNGQIDDSNTTTTPTLTGAGRWIMLSLLLLPFGFEFVGHDWFNVWLPEASSFKLSVFAIGMFFLGQPALVAFGVYLAWRPSWRPFVEKLNARRYLPWIAALLVIVGVAGAAIVSFLLPNVYGGTTNWHPLAVAVVLMLAGLALGFWSLKPNKEFWCWRNWTKHKSSHAGESILTLFMSKAVTRVDHKTAKSPDPTTIEFQKTFRDIIDAVSKPSVRYIFVVDNLDRLPEQAAVELWATIRSFFLGAKEQDAAASNRKLPTILLPIDPAAVFRMYEPRDKEQAALLAQAFMDKTFDITFRVPPPVFSEWRKYLEKQMKVVFASECENLWLYAAGELYERYLSGPSHAPVTPRLINALINSMAVLWLQWKGEVPFETVALYAINKSEIESNFAAFINQPHPDIARFDEGWAGGIAALHFGVPVESALQVYMRDPLKGSIARCDTTAFGAYASTPGFDHVFEGVLEDADGTIEFISHAAYLLGALDPPEANWVSSSWHRLITRLAVANPWKSLSQESVDGIKLLLLNCTEVDLKRYAAELAAKIAATDPTILQSSVEISYWAALAVTSLDQTEARNCHLPDLLFPGEASEYLELIAALSLRVDILRRISPRVSDNAIVEFLSTQFNKSSNKPEILESIFDTLTEIKADRPWLALAQAAGEALRNTSGELPLALAALNILGKLRKAKVSGVIDLLDTLYTEGVLFEKFAQANDADAVESAISSLALIILVNPSFETPTNMARAQAGLTQANSLVTDKDAISRMTERLDERLDEFSHGHLQKYFVDAGEGNAALRPLLKAIVTRRVLNRNQGKLNIDDVFARLPLYTKYMEDTSWSSFAADIAGIEAFWVKLQSIPFDDNVRGMFRLLLSCSVPDVVNRARGLLAERMKLTSIDEWTGAVQGGSEPLALARELHELQPSVDFGDGLYEALKKLNGEVQKSTDMDFLNRWFELSTFLSTNERATELRTLRDIFLREDVTDAVLPALKAGGSGLLSDGYFEEEADKSVRYLVLPLLALQQAEGWLDDNLDVIDRWIQSSPQETRGIVRERIAALWSDGDDAKKARMVALGDKLMFSEMPWNLPNAEMSSPNKKTTE